MTPTVASLWVPCQPAHVSANGSFTEWISISCQDAERFQATIRFLPCSTLDTPGLVAESGFRTFSQ